MYASLLPLLTFAVSTWNLLPAIHSNTTPTQTLPCVSSCHLTQRVLSVEAKSRALASPPEWLYQLSLQVPSEIRDGESSSGDTFCGLLNASDRLRIILRAAGTMPGSHRGE